MEKLVLKITGAEVVDRVYIHFIYVFSFDGITGTGHVEWAWGLRQFSMQTIEGMIMDKIKSLAGAVDYNLSWGLAGAVDYNMSWGEGDE